MKLLSSLLKHRPKIEDREQKLGKLDRSMNAFRI